MGGTSSSIEVAKTCVYNKADFETKINIIRDAHTIMQHYATILMSEKMPLKLEYLSYSDDSEEYFNSRRKDIIQELQQANQKIRNYYDFYNALNNLSNEYEKNDITENERRSKVTEVFNISNLVLRLLVEELLESCDSQGRPVPPVEIQNDTEVSEVSSE